LFPNKKKVGGVWKAEHHKKMSSSRGSISSTTATPARAFIIRDGGDPYAIKQQPLQNQQQHNAQIQKVVHTCVTDELLVSYGIFKNKSTRGKRVP
jgi:hypothetical protein